MEQYFNFEIYTSDPITGATGWEIKSVSVKAETKQQARENLKNFPLFDVVILFNFEHKEKETHNFLITELSPEYKVIDRF
jgi:hypothetical protein